MPDKLNALTLKAVIEAVGALACIGLVGYSLVTETPMTTGQLGIIGGVVGVYFGFSAVEHLRRNGNG